ncbi:MAG: LamG-like jellyroll fold domain-containing protein [Bacteroidales bacterium]
MKHFPQYKSMFSKRLLILAISALAAAQVFAVEVKFNVDMSYQINDGTFHPSTDHVYLRGAFNNWDLSNAMTSDGNGVYSTTINLASYTWYEFKFFTDASGFPNNGWEHTVGAGRDNRVITINTDAAFDIGKAYFNNANLILRKAGEYYELYCAEADTQYISSYAKYLDENVTRIVNVLETSMPGKVKIWIFPDRKSFMISYGNPTGPDWVGGSGFGHSDLIILTPRIYNNGKIDVGLIGHEFTHAVVDCKKISYVHAWLNEGAACYYGSEPSGIGLRLDGQIRDLINNKYHGIKPELSSIETYTFADNDGYPLSVSIADFIINTFGSSKFAQFIVNTDYSVLGFVSKAEFQAAWHKFLDDVYLPPTVITNLKVDLSYYISKGLFHPETDKVYIGGPFTSWFPYLLHDDGDGIYSYTLPCLQNNTYEYKFKISTAGADNGGWENLAGSNRTLTTSAKDSTLATLAFNNLNPTLCVQSPNGGELILAGDSVTISWKYTSIPFIKVEYSADKGASWMPISNSVSTAGLSINWKVPNVSSDNIIIRISDASNSTILDVSDHPFSVVVPDMVEGPYPADANTVLLMHFEGNLKNSSALSGNGSVSGTGPVFDAATPLKAGKSFALTGNNYISVPHCDALNLTGDWTIEAWVNFTAFGSNSMYLFWKPGNSDSYLSNYSLEVNPWWGNIFHGFYFSANVTRLGASSISPLLNQWYHVAFIRDTKASQISVIVHDQAHNLIFAYQCTLHRIRRVPQLQQPADW